ncbi:HepT-like ribonuclease domain-containing protein [Pricia antarctica]|uniref:HepT-like ribonuclease domain-containing protein n=1 Tax=Pricia antarctica TaxID=641691 RepID=UPI000B855620
MYGRLKTKVGFIRLLEIIGEAIGSISTNTVKRFPDVEWAIIKSFRNVLAHEYFGIDYQIVWKTVQSRIPELKKNATYCSINISISLQGLN